MKKHTVQTIGYIETPRIKTARMTVRIDSILEARIKEFRLSRRRLIWLKQGCCAFHK